jgi:class 3 adenylate cyclase/streptogramin lyase
VQRRSGALGAVLFTDIVDSTTVAAEMGNARWSELVARHHRIVRQHLDRWRGREIDTAGDGFFATFERPADAIRCAVATVEAVRELGIEIRAGVSFGELDTSGPKPTGLVVNTAARVIAVAGPGEVLVPVSVKEIVSGGGISFAANGTHRLKGLDGTFKLFRVTDVDGTPSSPPLEPEVAAARRREIFPTERRRTSLLVGLAAAALALAVVGALALNAGEEPQKDRGPFRNAIARIDVRTGQLQAPLFLGDRGIDSHDLTADVDRLMAVGEGGVWLLQPPFLVHVDPLHEDVRSDQIHVGAAESQAVDTGLGKVWVLSGRTLYEVHPLTDEAKISYELPARFALVTSSLAVGDAVWIGTSDGTLIRHDPFTRDVIEVDVASSIDAIAATQQDVWLADLLLGTVTRIDREMLDVVGKPVEITGSLDQLAATGETVWVLDRQGGEVTRIDAASGRFDDARVGGAPTEMAVTDDAVWVGDRDGSLYRVDAATLEVTPYPVGAEVLSVDVDAEGSPWVYVGDPVEGTAS